MIPVRIAGTGSHFPGRLVTTAEMAARAIPPIKASRAEAKTGIQTRWLAGPELRLADIAAHALRSAAEAAGIDVLDLKRVILASSSGGDIIGPATVNTTIHQLGLDNRCDCFDLCNGCLGFVTGLDLGARSVATGIYPVGVVAAETASRGIKPEDARPWLIFGDAASAAVLVPGRPGEGLLGVYLGNDGSLARTVYAEHPGVTRQMESLRMDLSNIEIGDVCLRAMRESAQRVLGQCGETLDTVDWVLPHQPNGVMLQMIVEALGVPADKLVPVVQEVGSLAAASIPVSLDRLLRTRPVKPGDRILMIGVGSGLSYGAALYRVAPSGEG